MTTLIAVRIIKNNLLHAILVLENTERWTDSFKLRRV